MLQLGTSRTLFRVLDPWDMAAWELDVPGLARLARLGINRINRGELGANFQIGGP